MISLTNDISLLDSSNRHLRSMMQIIKKPICGNGFISRQSHMAARMGIIWFLFCPPLGLFLFWLWVSVAPLVLQYAVSNAISYVDELFMVYICFIVLFGVLLRDFRIPSTHSFGILYVGLLWVIALSAIVNRAIPINVFQSILTYYLVPTHFFMQQFYILSQAKRTVNFFVFWILSLFSGPGCFESGMVSAH